MKFIGRIERGFDVLGYHFGPDGLSVAGKTFERFVGRAARLYEQESGEASASCQFGLYVQRWLRWAGAGIYDGVGRAAENVGTGVILPPRQPHTSVPPVPPHRAKT
jgi:hypothetical protein